jgi:xanthine dehydrogenase YagR molybdenum-binding subunit
MPGDTETLNWGPKDGHRLLNTRLTRVDGPKKATGVAVYTHDVRLPGMLYGRVICSPYSCARVTSVDFSQALKIPGVLAAVQGLADVRYEGTPVAAIAATSPEIADDAVHAVVVQYQQLPYVVTPDDAMRPGAAAVHPEDADVTNNIRPAETRGDADKVAEAFNQCDAVVDAEYRTATLHHTCLETHGAAADYRGGDSATVYCSTQSTFSIAQEAAPALGLRGSQVVGEVQYMGGGFGSKFSIGPEGQLACRLAKQAGAPVKLMLTRKEEFVMGGNGGAAWQKLKAGCTKDGKLVAMHSIQYRLGGIGRGSLAGQPYIYKVGTSYREVSDVHTHIDASRPLRAPGRQPACFAIESLVDELADKIGMDPIEFRKQNVFDESHLRQIAVGAKAIGWEKRSATAGGWPGTLKRGFGCALGDWGGGGRAQCLVNLVVGRDGSVNASVGSQDLGTGTRTYIRAIVAEELGLEMSDVQEEIGSSRLSGANASGGSSTAPSLAPAVKDAAVNARVAMANRLAPLLGAQPEDVKFDHRTVSANGKTLAWADACNALPAAGVRVQGRWKKGLSSSGTHGVSFAEVEVDMETGHIQPIKMVSVQDCGLPLNRLAVESQINGGMIQGIGMALLEGRVMDVQSGVMVNSSFMDYKIAGCMEMPELVPIIDDGDPRNEVVGMGEPPSVPPAAAIVNAVYNACGVRVRDLPITPDKILMGLSQKA